jgi:uncharacterized Zn finger protein
VHYFNFELPTLDEDQEEIFYRHPDYPVYCNQLGVLYIDKDFDFEFTYTSLNENISFHLNGVKVSKQKLKLIYECYTGDTKRISGQRTLNGNPYNTVYDNVVFPESQKELAVLNFLDFSYHSVSFMMKRDIWLKERGIEPSDYWSHFKLPNWLRVAYGKKITKVWERSDDIPRVTKKTYTKRNGVTQKQLELDERARIVRKKLAEGNSVHRIRLEMGISRQAVIKAMERVLPEDI